MGGEKQFVSVGDVAKACLVTRATVLSWFRRGWIPGYRAGRSPVLFDLDEVRQSLAERAARRDVPSERGGHHGTPQ